METKQIAIPKLWNDGNNLKKLAIINPGDFNILGSLRGMDLVPTALWNSLGVCDTEEIKERNGIMKLLFENPGLRVDMLEILAGRKNLELPTTEDTFLLFHEAVNNPYWLAVKRVVAGLEAAKVEGRLETFRKHLVTALSLESQEKELGIKVSERLKSVAVMEGVFTVNVIVHSGSSSSYVGNVETDYIHGYKLFNSSYAPTYQPDIPKWLKKSFWRWLGITSIVQKSANNIASANAKHSAQITFFSDNLKSDLTNGFRFSVLPSFHPNGAISEGAEIEFTLYFKYSSKGLFITPLTVVQPNEIGFFWDLNQEALELSSKQVKYLEKKAENLRAVLSESATRAKSINLYSCFPANFFGKKRRIASSGTDYDYRYFAIGHIYNHLSYRDVYTRITNQRTYFFETLKQIQQLSNILNKFEEKAKKLNIPLCIPTISLVEHSGVSFSKLAPISLSPAVIDLIPITLERINGQIVGLTGRHGGGKTVAGKTILENVYLAQSGLPVFAESFTTDIKTVLGAVTNDEGEGSTATVFVKKVMNLMEQISLVPVNESLVFIDEIGKGTQQNSGIKLGKAILTALSKGGNSVLFNTQILELAEYAEAHLNAVCYKVDKDHNFVKGIGDGEIMALVEEVGLDKYLEMN